MDASKKEQLASTLEEFKEAIDNDSVFDLISAMDKIEELTNSKFLDVVLAQFAPAIEEGEIYNMINSCNNETEDQGGAK